MQVKIDTKILASLISSVVVVIIFSTVYSISYKSSEKNVKPYTPDMDLNKIDPTYHEEVQASLEKKELSTTPLKKDSFNEGSFFVDWSYSSQKSWPTLDSSFLPCREGKDQSPIDIVKSKTIASKLDFSTHYAKDKIYLSSNNKEFKIRPDKLTSFVTFQGEKYILEKIDVHAPSEHTFDSLQYELELEFFHTLENSSKDVLIVSVLYEKSSLNPALDPILQALPEKFNFETKVDFFDISSLITSNSFYYYIGSLSIPPCTQNIKRIVATKLEPISEKQLDEFHAKFSYGNARDTQTPTKQQDILFFHKGK